MIILVSDTSVLIDLERGGLLESTFSCGLTLVVPDYLYQRELEAYNGQYLRALGLGVIELTPQEVAIAQLTMIQCKGLSLVDCFALTCAMRPSHALMTGDAILRNEAKSRNAIVYGLLWVLDFMESSGLAYSLLHEALNKISAGPKCRLPKDEVKKRLIKWSS